MTTSMTANRGNLRAWQPRGAAGWLGLAASPTFALMAGIAASDAPGMPICSTASGALPIDGMAWMYLLMSVFNLSPWLKLASGGRRRLPIPTTRTKGD